MRIVKKKNPFLTHGLHPPHGRNPASIAGSRASRGRDWGSIPPLVFSSLCNF